MEVYIMCTAVTYNTKDFYFGRTLDYEFSYGECVVITPRNYAIHLHNSEIIPNHYAIIGMAHVEDDYPLYYDAMNEKGLCMAGLNFVENAHYHSEHDKLNNKINIASYEFILWILAKCSNVDEANNLISTIILTDASFNKNLPPTMLHWIIADKNKAITIESTRSGIHVYNNPIGVLTNNPPFPVQLFNLNNYMSLSAVDPINHFTDKYHFNVYSKGMGALGLPGDWSSQSRFVRAAFVKLNSISGDSEKESVNQLFHILNSVNIPRGCCRLKNGNNQTTIYTSCLSAANGVYYYSTYENKNTVSINMHSYNLNETKIHMP